MSELNNDKKPIEEGRKRRLEGVDAPLRDQIVDKLFAKLEDAEIGARVESIWNKWNANRTVWTDRQRAWFDSWDQHLTASADGDDEGASQLHIPMPYTICKTVHARYMQAIWQDPPFHVRANNEASMERTSLVSDTMRYYLLRGANHNKGVGKIIDQWVWDWVTMGSAVMKLRWETTYTRFRDVRLVKKPGAPQFAIGPDGNEVPIPTEVEEEEEFDNTKKCFDGPVFELVNLEDLAIIGGDGDPDSADAVLQRQYLTASELWTLADRKIFKEDCVEKVIEGGPDPVDGSVGSDAKRQRTQNAGKSVVDSDEDLDRYEILEAYLKVDVDGSGINSDVIVWVHPRSKTLLRATYLYRVSKTGERPFVKADFQYRKGSEFGVGLVEMLYPLSIELDAMHNMRIDWGLVSVMPFGFYRPTSGIDPVKIKLEPGVLIPVDQPQTDVFFPNLGNRTVFGMQEEASLHQIIERLTSVSDLNLGAMSSQGATRTATGARALVGEMSSNLDVFLRRLNWGWEKALRYLLHLLQQRIPPGLSFRLTGDSGQDYFRFIRNQDDIGGDFDIEVSPNSNTSNAAVQQELAADVLQQVMNPLAIQMGLSTPANLYNAYETYFRAKGVRDFGKYLTKPQMPLRQLTPEEEANRVLRGIFVPLTPEMDHQGFIDFFNMIYDNDELLGQFSEDQTVMLAQQAKKHEQMLAALRQVAAQNANAQQMRQNAAMSAQQAPPALPVGGEGGGPMPTGGGMAG